MTTDKAREEFETWARENFTNSSVWRLRRREDGTYHDLSTKTAYEAWQFATLAERERAKGILIQAAEDIRTHVFQSDLDAVEERLREASSYGDKKDG